MTVTEVEQTLKLSQWEPRLKAVKGVWKQLQTLKADAKDPKRIKKYQDILGKAISRVSAEAAEEAALTANELYQAAKEYYDWFHGQAEELHRRACARGASDWLTWLEKWAPAIAEDYKKCFLAVIASPSKKTFNQLRVATQHAISQFVPDPKS